MLLLLCVSQGLHSIKKVADFQISADSLFVSANFYIRFSGVFPCMYKVQQPASNLGRVYIFQTQSCTISEALLLLGFLPSVSSLNSFLCHLLLVRLQFLTSGTTGSGECPQTNKQTKNLINSEFLLHIVVVLKGKFCPGVFLRLITFPCLQIFFLLFHLHFMLLSAKAFISEFIFPLLKAET